MANYDDDDDDETTEYSISRSDPSNSPEDFFAFFNTIQSVDWIFCGRFELSRRHRVWAFLKLLWLYIKWRDFDHGSIVRSQPHRQLPRPSPRLFLFLFLYLSLSFYFGSLRMFVLLHQFLTALFLGELLGGCVCADDWSVNRKWLFPDCWWVELLWLAFLLFAQPIVWSSTSSKPHSVNAHPRPPTHA